MPVQPDPTHPKFVEGDDVLKPPNEQDDVEGHLAAAVPEEVGPEDLAAVTPEESEDVEGHVVAPAVPEDLAAGIPDEDEDVEGDPRVE